MRSMIGYSIAISMSQLRGPIRGKSHVEPLRTAVLAARDG